jgi:hypothetical protein
LRSQRVAMTFEELIAGVGAERYRAACECAWRISPGDEWPDDLEDVPHYLSDVWYDDEMPLAARLELALRVYREMPCYGNAMYFKLRHDEFGREEKRVFWATWRAALDSDDDRLAEPATYSLWVDFFEDRSTVKEAWREMTSAFDVCGDYKPRVAERWLGRLQLPDDAPDLAALRRHLAG